MTHPPLSPPLLVVDDAVFRNVFCIDFLLLHLFCKYMTYPYVCGITLSFCCSDTLFFCCCWLIPFWLTIFVRFLLTIFLLTVFFLTVFSFGLFVTLFFFVVDVALFWTVFSQTCFSSAVFCWLSVPFVCSWLFSFFVVDVAIFWTVFSQTVFSSIVFLRGRLLLIFFVNTAYFIWSVIYLNIQSQSPILISLVSFQRNVAKET